MAMGIQLFSALALEDTLGTIEADHVMILRGERVWHIRLFGRGRWHRWLGRGRPWQYLLSRLRHEAQQWICSDNIYKDNRKSAVPQ
jgi:hypothetical protein